MSNSLEPTYVPVIDEREQELLILKSRVETYAYFLSSLLDDMESNVKNTKKLLDEMESNLEDMIDDKNKITESGFVINKHDIPNL